RSLPPLRWLAPTPYGRGTGGRTRRTIWTVLTSTSHAQIAFFRPQRGLHPEARRAFRRRTNQSGRILPPSERRNNQGITEVLPPGQGRKACDWGIAKLRNWIIA